MCTGSLLLGAAGVLDGLRGDDALAGAGAARASSAPSPSSERVVEQGKVITAAGRLVGHRHGADAGRRIAGDEFAQGIQLGIEYDPQPPFDAGSTRKAPPEIVELVRAAAKQLA